MFRTGVPPHYAIEVYRSTGVGLVGLQESIDEANMDTKFLMLHPP